MNSFWLKKQMTTGFSRSILIEFIEEFWPEFQSEFQSKKQPASLVNFALSQTERFSFLKGIQDKNSAVLHNFDWLIFHYFLQLIFRLTTLTSAAKSK